MGIWRMWGCQLERRKNEVKILFSMLYDLTHYSSTLISYDRDMLRQKS